MQWIEGVECGSSLRSCLTRFLQDEDWTEESNLVKSASAADRLDRLDRLDRPEVSQSSMGLSFLGGVDASLPDIFTHFVFGRSINNVVSRR